MNLFLKGFQGKKVPLITSRVDLRVGSCLSSLFGNFIKSTPSFLQFLSVLLLAVSSLAIDPITASAAVNNTLPIYTLVDEDTDELGELDRLYFMDLNGDTYTDIIATPFGGSSVGRVLIFFNNQDGTFADGVSYDITTVGVSRVQSPHQGDFDGDGDIDFAAIGVNSANSALFTNDGTGNFTMSAITNGSDGNLVMARVVDVNGAVRRQDRGAFVDLDGDGDLDYSLGDYSGTDWSVYLYDSGNFTNTDYTTTSYTGALAGHYSRFLDVDGDNDVDRIEYFNGTSGQSVSYYVWKNNGAGVFTEFDSFTTDAAAGPVPSRSQPIFFDIDKDNDVDIIANGLETGNRQVYVNDGSGLYSLQQTINLEPGTDLELSNIDLDGDGDQDLAICNIATDTSELYMNDGTGGLVHDSSVSISYCQTTTDVNADGEQDVVSSPGAGSALGTELSIRFGTAPFSFQATSQTLLDIGEEYIRDSFNVSSGVANLDLNKDGFRDIVMSMSTYNPGRGDENKIQVYLNTDNDRDGLTNTEESTLRTDSTTSDTDGDGISDLVEHTTGTSPADADTDGDGIDDGKEDANQDGVLDLGESDPRIKDSDTDGVTEAEEYASPNDGDSNDDGVLDATQNSVAAAINTSIGSDAYNSLAADESAECSQITKFGFESESSLGVQDEGYTYPVGLFDFALSCTSDGGQASLTFILDKEYNTSSWQWRKFNPATKTYVDMSNEVMFSTMKVAGVAKTIASLSIVDGEALDDDGQVNSEIFDPSGPAIVSDSTLADTGLRALETTLVGVLAIILTVGVAAHTNKRYSLRG